MLTCDYPGCTAQYRRKEHLTRHARKHAPTAQRLICEECDKAFDRTDSLRRHRLLHRRERQNGGDVPRTVKACDQCHASKTRCDGTDPCDICTRKRRRCTFDRSMRVGGPALTSGNSSHGQSRVSRSPLEAIANDATRTNRRHSVRQTTITGPEIQDLLLQHENNLREKGLLGTPPRTSQPQDQGNDLDIDKYVAVYFSYFHFQWPIVHRFSFGGTRIEPQILVLALAMIGLWVTGEKSARERAESMHEKLLALLENRMDEWKLDHEFTNKSWPMSTYQTIVLNIIFAIIRDVDKDTYDRCRILLDAITTTCTKGGLFDYANMHALLEPADSVLYSWTYMEETKRLALTIFKLNHHFNTGMLRFSDLRFALPDSGYLWDAPETKDFYRRFHAQVESGTRPCVENPPQLICDIVSDVREGRKGLGLLFQADSWLGFVALARALSQLTKGMNVGKHACGHSYGHQPYDWFLQMDSWGQLELLRQILCRRSPDLKIAKDLLSDIDTVLSYKKGHALLTPSSSISPRIVVDKTRIYVWKGDITALTDVTAIVNAANSALLGCFQPSHRCIDNVIHSAAGPRLREACYELMLEQGHDEPVGRAKVTPGFNLHAQYVVHTVGPELGNRTTPSELHRKQLSDCYKSCLDAVEALPALADGRKVIAFCCISTGLFAFPSDLAAQIAIDTVTRWCVEHPETTITDIIFDTFLQKDFDLYNAKMQSLGLNDASTKVLPALPAAAPNPSTSMSTARSWLNEADYLIISAGAGLSAATGLDYTSPDLFAKYFPAFLPLGLRRLYDVFGFNGWKSPLQKWGYYIHHLNMVRTWPASPLYASLLKMAASFGSRCFVRTSNADGLFVANGFQPSRVSTPQGQYAYLQCFATCRREAVFPSAPFLNAALPHLDPTTQELTDISKIPSCKYCGGELTLCVRGGDYFNDSPFQGQEREYTRFLEHVSFEIERGKKAVVLELGVGLNTPSILRWPNEELVEEAGVTGGIRLIRAGMDAAGCVPWELEEEGVAVGISGDLGVVVGMLGGK
ncbi:hypothetical protein BDW74DRAFT_171824 [Aspergillus multicolor]|uniref:uncharacterized protein n=1 Tax=Aspergillus multicolor TaxID=41759 RepID=UPI003CCE3B54